jgi:hypothetical protein
VAGWVRFSRRFWLRSPPNLPFHDSWSYLINLTYIGNAIFVSMDIPDTLLAVGIFCFITVNI